MNLGVFKVNPCISHNVLMLIFKLQIYSHFITWKGKERKKNWQIVAWSDERPGWIPIPHDWRRSQVRGRGHRSQGHQEAAGQGICTKLLRGRRQEVDEVQVRAGVGDVVLLFLFLHAASGICYTFKRPYIAKSTREFFPQLISLNPKKA